MKSTHLLLVSLFFLFSFGGYSQNWDEILKVCASDREELDNFGRSVAIEGNWAVVGAWQEDENALGVATATNAGSAYVFFYNGTRWVEFQKIVAADRSAEDYFGNSVAIYGDIVVVGAWSSNTDELSGSYKENAGAVYIFQYISGTWTQIQKLVASDRQIDDYFGVSVAIDGDYIVVGAHNEDAGGLLDAGSAYIFKDIAGTWTQIQKIGASDFSEQDYFGYSVDIHYPQIVVGAYNNSEDENGLNTVTSAGAAYVFYDNGVSWTQTSKIVAPVRAVDDYFGYDVAIHDSNIVVGAYKEDEDATDSQTLLNSGSAYVFSSVSGSAAVFEQKLVASTRHVNARFGHSVAIDNQSIVVGANFEAFDLFEADSLLQAGAVYMYKFDGSWVQEQKIISSQRSAADYFGYDVSISDTLMIVGAMYEFDDADGLDPLDLSGAAYIFENCREINVYQEANQIDDGGTYDFGSVQLGNSSTELVFTIENTGVDNLFLDGSPVIELSGLDAADFVINQTGISTLLPPLTATTFTVVFTPSVAGLRTAEISIANNDNDENPYNFTITGIGEKIPQNITDFNVIEAKTYGDEDFLVSASATSGLDVIFTSSDEGVAICGGVNGSTITIVGEGTCEIYADQPGNELYQIAPQLSQTLVVNQKPITVTVDPGQGKEYGEVDPELTFTITDGSLVGSDSFLGTLSRVAGETLGSYEIEVGTLSAGPNYIMSFVEDDFVISERVIFVTVNPNQSKIYGTMDPGLTYSYTPELVDGDSFAGSISRVVGEDVGFYEIQQNTLNLNSNYIIDFTSDDFEIVAKQINITPNPTLTKIYGNSDPIFTYSASPALASGDSFSGVLSRELGEDVGLYDITIGTLTAGDNYNLTLIDEEFEIFPKPITVVPHNFHYKYYGDIDPEFSYYTIGMPVSGDDFSGSLSRTTGENIGFYPITLGSLSLGPNYNLTLQSTTVYFEIKVKNIVITVDPDQYKEYGDPEPELTYTIGGNIAPWDSFIGSIVREPGEVVGSYAITQGTLQLNSNYIIHFFGDDFEIVPQSIIVTVDPNQTKVYGEPNPAEYTYSYTGTLASGDSFTGALIRDYGEDVGNYPIVQGTLFINSNYFITFNSDDFEITERPITVTADPNQSKVYGDSDPAEFAYTFTGVVVSGDNFTGALTRESGENVGLYQIQMGSLSLGSNYDLSYVPDDFNIVAKPVTITADAGQSKIYGESDPELTFTITGGLVSGDTYSGALSRDFGENVGFYAISQGSLVLPNNYDVSYVGADFEIIAKEIVVNAEPDQNKIYGEADPDIFQYNFTGTLETGDEFSGELLRESGENAGLYEILLGTLSISENYNIIYNSDNFEILKATPVITWENPADIYYGTELSATQLNAIADVPGSFVYTPDFGVVLEVADNQPLSVVFTPTDNLNYNNAEATVYINVLLEIGIDDSEINFAVYPNPTKDFVFIKSDMGNINSVTIYDMSGRVVLHENNGGSLIRMDVESLSSGVYYIDLEINNSRLIDPIKLVKTDK
ncbi:MAG: choice-of-anchor D domain-containing protein [Bacteroidales bacterium]|nr:choice-of-anchor D domain-containing protein [Bacteroidales bacterium]